jgi:hypothetical protein
MYFSCHHLYIAWKVVEKPKTFTNKQALFCSMSTRWQSLEVYQHAEISLCKTNSVCSLLFFVPHLWLSPFHFCLFINFVALFWFSPFCSIYPHSRCSFIFTVCVVIISRSLDVVISGKPFSRAYGVKVLVVCCRHAFFLLSRVHPVLIMLSV